MQRTIWVLFALVAAAACGKDDGSGKSNAGGDAGVLEDGGDPDGRDAAGSQGDAGTGPDAEGPNDGGTTAPDGGGFDPGIAELDESFGIGGVATASVAAFGTGAVWDVGEQPDGKLIVFGRNYAGWALVRITEGGAVDRSFGDGGYVHAPYGRPRNGVIYGYGEMEVASDGSIVVASHYVSTGNIQIALLAKYGPDGELDQTFGDDGLVVVEPGPNQITSATTLGLQSDGKIVVGLYDLWPIVRRYETDGTVDTTFGTDGEARVSYGGQAADVLGLKVLSDDSVLVTGQAYAEGAGIGIAKFTADGSVDTSFGDGTGWVRDTAKGTAQPSGYALAELPDGGFVVAGARPKEDDERSSNFAVGRFAADGALDSSFGTAGWALDTSERGRAFAVDVQSDGKILAVGSSDLGGSMGGLARFDATGQLDTSFAQGGVAGPAGALGVAVQANDEIIVVGSTRLRRLNPDGTADSTFGGEETDIGHAIEAARAVAATDEGGILVGGTPSIAGGSALMKFTAAGVLDSTFGNAGVAQGPLVTPHDFAFDSTGRILVGGSGGGGTNGFKMSRVAADGTIDQEFSQRLYTPGAIADSQQILAMNMAYVDDQTIYLSGAYVVDMSIRAGVIKIDSNGDVDASWGTDGVASYSTGARVLPFDSNGKILVMPDGGVLLIVAGPAHKFDASGQLDTTFGDEGKLPGAGRQSYLGPDGIVTGFVRRDDDGNAYFEVARYALDGTLDTSFGSDGFARADIGPGETLGVAFGPDAQGGSWIATSTGDFRRRDVVAVRFDASGVLDTTVGEDGRLDMRLSTHSSELHATTFDAMGRQLFVGSIWTPEDGYDFGVIRLQ